MSDYKAIDWRLRPPYKSFGVNQIFDAAKANPDDTTISEAARTFSMDLLLKEMDENGIAVGVVPFRCGQDQSDIDEIMTLYPGRFQCLAHIDPYCEDSVAEIDKYIVNGKAAGAIIEPGQYFIKRPVPADDKILWPIYEKCEAENILLTITFGGLYNEALELYNPIYIDRVAKMFPNLKMVLAHGGWPYTQQVCQICYQRPNVYLSPDYYLMSVNPGHEDYVTMANNVLRDRIIFGSCYPGISLDFAIQEYIKSGIKPGILPDILYNNAAKLLGLE